MPGIHRRNICPLGRPSIRPSPPNGDVGIWHETYLIQPGAYESICNCMPMIGLSAAGTLVDAIGARQSAHQRIKTAVNAAT